MWRSWSTRWQHSNRMNRANHSSRLQPNVLLLGKVEQLRNRKQSYHVHVRGCVHTAAFVPALVLQVIRHAANWIGVCSYCETDYVCIIPSAVSKCNTACSRLDRYQSSVIRASRSAGRAVMRSCLTLHLPEHAHDDDAPVWGGKEYIHDVWNDVMYDVGYDTVALVSIDVINDQAIFVHIVIAVDH